jgi:hypothetical protein
MKRRHNKDKGEAIMLKKILLFMLMLMFSFVVAINAKDRKIIKPHSTIKSLNCSNCHACVTPSQENPCLELTDFLLGKGEPLTPYLMPPDYVYIEELENLYEPVEFNHKAHLHTAETTFDCADCHHYSPLDEKPPCKECHSPNNAGDDPGQVSLNAAYHRRCLTCHAEWSKNTNCELCHTSKNAEVAEKLGELIPEFRKAQTPEKKVYVNRLFTGPYVTFFHDYHVKQDNVYCADCHVKTACVSCHYQGEQAPKKVALIKGSGVHEPCRLCHDVISQGTCIKCHKDSEQASISGMR